MRSLAVFCLCLSISTLLAQNRIVPHLTAPGGGFTTEILLENSGPIPGDWTLTPYDQDGHALESVTGILAPNTVLSTAAAELVGDSASHFTISGDHITVTVAYSAVASQGSPAHVSETDQHATRHRLNAGNWSTVFDGFAVVNTGQLAADIWVAQRDIKGAVTQTARIATALPPMGKTLYVAGGPSGSIFDATAGNTFEIYAEQTLAVTALRGNLPEADFLWSNPTRATGHATSKRDEQGVWFIEGGSLYDVSEMMGYNVASDRLWQMETFRRTGRGRLSEIALIATPGTIEEDRFNRIVGYSEEEYQQAFADMLPDAQTAVRAYTDGINRRRAETRADNDLLPIEFKALGIEMEPWTTSDVLAVTISFLRIFDQQDYGRGQLHNAAILEFLQTNYPDQAADMFNDLRWINDPDAPTMIPSDGAAAKIETPKKAGALRSDINFTEVSRRFQEQHEAREEAVRKLNAKPRMGSYAWVVAADRTQSGNPIIYSGPQMSLRTPSVVVEGSINGGGLNVSGASVPGIPGIIIGRTPHHAWSMQVGHANTMDLYIEPALTAEMLHRTESVIAGSAGPQDLNIYRSEHGPLISTDPPIAWKYAHWNNEFDTIQAFLDLARAQSMNEFGEILTRVGVSQHFCYADNEGNIAYWMSGRNPVRPEGEYRFPQGAIADAPVLEYDVDNRHPLVHDRNTSQGFYGGWNNKSRADVTNSNVSSDRYYGPFHRSLAVETRLHDLTQRGDVTFEEVRDLAARISGTERHARASSAIPFTPPQSLSVGGGGGNPWPLLSPAFTAAVQADTTPERSAALDILAAWDGRFIEGDARDLTANNRSDGWMLMDAWVRNMLNHTFDEIDAVTTTDQINTMIHGLDPNGSLQNSYDWFTSLDPDAPQTADALILQSLDDALTALGERPWGTDKRGEVHYNHPLLSLLTGEPLHIMPYSNRSTYGHCVELDSSGPVRIESLFPLGQSGNAYGEGFNFVLDPNVLSMTPFFDDFTHRVFPLFPQ